MSRKLLAFLLSELTTIRIICSRDVCRAVTEVTPDRFEAVASRGMCPVCNHDLIPSSSHNSNSPFLKLAQAIAASQAILAKEGTAQIEFVLPDEE